MAGGTGAGFLRTAAATDPTYLGVRTLFTIHNLGYQGLFPRTALADVALPAVCIASTVWGFSAA